MCSLKNLGIQTVAFSSPQPGISGIRGNRNKEFLHYIRDQSESGISDVGNSRVRKVLHWFRIFRTFRGSKIRVRNVGKAGILLGFRGGSATLCLCMDVSHLARRCERVVRAWWRCGTGVRGRVWHTVRRTKHKKRWSSARCTRFSGTLPHTHKLMRETWSHTCKQRFLYGPRNKHLGPRAWAWASD